MSRMRGEAGAELARLYRWLLLRIRDALLDVLAANVQLSTRKVPLLAWHHDQGLPPPKIASSRAPSLD